jgi:hypothetical protein
MNHKYTAKVDELIRKIKQLPGDKIITISAHFETSSFDVSASGKIGYHRSHTKMLHNLISSCFASSGGIIIRQFTSIKVEIETPGGKLFVPIKNIYGILIENGDYHGLSAIMVEKACCTDQNGLPIPKEQAVRYCEFFS